MSALRYIERGSGHALLLVHGVGGDPESWIESMDLLAARFRVIAPELRGFGRSEPEPVDSIDRHADDVVALIDALELGPCALVGLSMGGTVAQTVALRRGSLLGALVLVDTLARASELAQQVNVHFAALAEAEGSGAVGDGLLPSMFGLGPKPRWAPAVERAFVSTDRTVLATALRAIARFDVLDQLHTIDAPALVVCGERDPLMPDSEAISAGIHDSELQVIAGAGHLAPFEAPQEFAAMVTEFLDRRARW